ncbi:hypothetical protein ACVXG7_25380 [Enterobacter hormaechei]
MRTEMRWRRILGYGKKADFKPIFDQVKSIEQKSAGGKSGKGWFDELKTRIQKLFEVMKGLTALSVSLAMFAFSPIDSPIFTISYEAYHHE